MFHNSREKRSGRGAVSNPPPRYLQQHSEEIDDGWQTPMDDALPVGLGTSVLPDQTRTIIARNSSPDINFDRSINPYKGCEHGCIYCFARPSHAWLDLSPGVDFETRLFYKVDAADRLRQELRKPGYDPAVLALGTNTDPYQPVERELRVTRSVLEVLLEAGHPVSIVTKGSLIERDLDLLARLAELNLVNVMVSVTTLSDGLKRVMEPRAAAPGSRLRTIRRLRDAGVPVGVLMAPVIPAINDHEPESIVAAVAAAGAQTVAHVVLRLPLEVRQLFMDWLDEHFPDRAQRVMTQVYGMRGGHAYDASWGVRHRGTGAWAELLAQRVRRAARKAGIDQRLASLRTDLFVPPADGRQLEMFR